MEAHRTRRRRRPGTVALKEIRQLQRSTGLLMGKLPFARLVHFLNVLIFRKGVNLEVRDISNGMTPHQYRWTAEALLSLQEVKLFLYDPKRDISLGSRRFCSSFVRRLQPLCDSCKKSDHQSASFRFPLF